jgi:predicted O-methyltransferase YrrM
MIEIDRWIDDNIRYNQTNHAGAGLVPIFNELGSELTGAELGVCMAASTEYFAINIKNLKKLYAVDNYPSYTDWNGTEMTAYIQNRFKEHAANRIAPYPMVEVVYESSDEFASHSPQLDFVFIDGDHSYDGVMRDIKNYYPLVRSGGIVSGHDFKLRDVGQALSDFFRDKEEVIPAENNCWYVRKK